MKRPTRLLAALILGSVLLTPSAAHGVALTLNGELLNASHSPIYNDTTYVSLRAIVTALRPGADVRWEKDRAVAVCSDLTLTAKPGDYSLLRNGQQVKLNMPVRLENGRTLVPVRPLASLLGAEVTWNAYTGVVALSTGKSAQTWSDDDLYWLSHIISAESQGECWEGKIAVGNVVLNRVLSPDFPDTICEVIFDSRWGGQFEPVRNGTVYLDPTEESVRAALACLEGENTVGRSLYFLAPDLTDNHWTMENRPYVTTIGTHWFYE